MASESVVGRRLFLIYFFADDSILFCRANESEAKSVRNLLQQYELASGQKINLDKSEMTVSRNVSEFTRTRICQCLGVRDVEYHKSYLGLPTLIGKSKKKVFEVILDRVQSKLKKWNEKTLSRAGKEVLLKVVIQAIPTYSMSCFLLPISLCEEIEKSMARFYWGASEHERKIHWNSWSCLTLSKREGGLGFREFHCFNKAMLAKQMWNIMLRPNSIIGKILKAKYFLYGDLLNASIGHQPSFLWRSLLASRDLLNAGIAWRVGNGRQVRIREDKWIGQVHPSVPRDVQQLNTDLIFVSELIDSASCTWKKELIYNSFQKDNVDQICGIPLSSRFPEDKVIWGPDKKGRFTVRSAYHLAVSLFSNSYPNHASSSSHPKEWKQLWQCGLTPRIQHFLWRACVDSLPTLDNLYRRGVCDDAVCQLCGLEMESLSHLMLRCKEVQSIWRYGPLRLDLTNNHGDSFKQVLWALLDKLPKEAFSLFACSAWCIWKARNKFYLEKQEFKIMDILNCAHRLWMEMEKERPHELGTNFEPRSPQSWKPPPAGMLKMNCDVDVLQDGRVGLGVIFRDDKGGIIFASKVEAVATGSTTILEGIALRYGLQMALQQNLSNLHAESDNQTLIKGICGETELEPYGEVLKEDIVELARRLNVISFKYVPRSCNMAAHMVARSDSFFGTNNIPANVCSIVQNETI